MGGIDHPYHDHNHNLKFDHKDPKKQSQFASSKIECRQLKTIITHKPAIILFFYLILFTGFFFTIRHLNAPRKPGSKSYKESISSREFPLICSAPNKTQKCPSNMNREFHSSNNQNACPEYFKWILEDLKPWKSSGITLEMVEEAKRVAFFRLVVVNGRVYLDKYKEAFQTRDVFTIWGILQLLRLYHGRLPDLDLMFECNDKPVISKDKYKGSNVSFVPPPVFHYCGDDLSYDIVFPDWSFWGWPEINIKPWEVLVKELEEGNRRIKWEDREPFAYWKGNLHMGQRHYLLSCNSTQQWGAQIYSQKWALETKHGFRDSNLAHQCTHRYKIYMEGKGWSVSEKYIQACDSMLLMVKSRYYEFFSRSLVPMKHYWPLGGIRSMCKSIKAAVQWGNNNPQKAQEIGKSGSKFIMEDLKMQNVYDYMFHLLNEYGKLLRYKPTIPVGAMEICSETMACSAQGKEKASKIESFIKLPSKTGPCIYHMHKN